jgi:hypothetical protein
MSIVSVKCSFENFYFDKRKHEVGQIFQDSGFCLSGMLFILVVEAPLFSFEETCLHYSKFFMVPCLPWGFRDKNNPTPRLQGLIKG